MNSKTISVDVAVIGAGMAGLAACTRLRQSGLDVVLLEARDRIGGRAWTEKTKRGAPVELGAEFVHGKPPEIMELLRLARLKAQPVEGEMWRFKDGRWRRSDKLLAREENVLDRLRVGTRDISYAQLLRQHPRRIPRDIQEWLCKYIEGFHAADPEKVSVRALVEGTKTSEDIEGDYTQRITRGYSALAEFLLKQASGGRNFQLRLSSPVEKITWGNGSVAIEIASSRVHARCAIVTLPVSLMKARSVRFVPELRQKSPALAKLEMGPVTRITLEFAERFWAQCKAKDGKRLNQLSFLFTQNKDFPTWWTALPLRAPVITGWTAGPHSLQLSGRSAEEICARSLLTLAKIFCVSAGELEGNLRSFHTHDWQSDRLSQGAYSYAAVGGAHAFDELARPIEQTLFFAGEATSRRHNGTVHGAMGTGYRAAEEVLLILEKEKRVASKKQTSAARRNIKKAAAAAKRERTISHLPKSTRTALGKQGAKAARRKRAA